ncbi:peroxiredoxin-1-like [Schistocerca gregaria]|uniref:peroxiredoxin-1-like n=1 Tax=Schistocerca gregaria TaxID=7010 RepID=UPI00211E40F9|nr:peroxiredoxin-1-like [Schistocerca gregaria]
MPCNQSIQSQSQSCSHGCMKKTHVIVPRIGCPAPDFKVTALMPNKEFKEISLSDYKGKWLVLFFYPLDFTFVCPTEITSFSDESHRFEELNVSVLGASIDSKFSHLAWTNKPRNEGGLGDIKIPILSDLNKTVAHAYGALYLDTGHTLRASYIIDDKGILRHIAFNDPGVGRSTEEMLRLVGAYIETDKHGEVCPANWNKGKKTITPGNSKEYFSSLP